jgi:hypothetical protein
VAFPMPSLLSPFKFLSRALRSFVQMKSINPT